MKFSKKELLNKNFLNFIYKEDLEKVKTAYLKREKGQMKNIPFELRVINKNKEIIWIKVNGALIDWEEDKAVLYFINDITDSKLLETELRYSEETTKALLNATNDMAFLIDTNGKILVINDVAAKRIDKTKNFFRNSPPYLLDLRKKMGDEVVKTDKPVSYEEVHTERVYANTVYPIRNEKKEITRFAIYAHDFTNYKKAVDELKKSEERFKTMIENSLDGILILDKLGFIKFVTDNIKNVLGYTPDQLLGKNSFSFIYTLDYKKIFHAMTKMIKDPSYKELIEFRIMHKNGNWIYVEGIGSNFLKNNIINGIIITFRDISERKKSQSELNIYKYIISSSSDQIFFINNNYIILAANDSLLNAFDLKKENVIGISLSVIFGESDFREYLKNYCDQCFSGLEANFERWYNYPAAGKRYMSFSLYPYSENNRIIGIVINLRDMTERVEMESDIIDLREKEQQKIGIELHDGLTHTLLGIAIKSRILADKLKSRAIPEEKDARDIEHLINYSIEETRSLAHGLFHSDLEYTDIKNLLKNIKIDIESKFNLVCDIIYDEESAEIDIKIITQFYYIIQESVKNAVKHGGAKKIIIKIEYEKSFLCLTVKDNGKGISFENYKNKGMGLNIMKYRARMIGGTLDIQKSHPSGTIIKCMIKNF